MKIGQHYTPATFAIFQRMADLAVEIRRDLDAIEDRTPVLNRIEDRVSSIQVLLRDASRRWPRLHHEPRKGANDLAQEMDA